MTMLEVHYWD